MVFNVVQRAFVSRLPNWDGYGQNNIVVILTGKLQHLKSIIQDNWRIQIIHNLPAPYCNARGKSTKSCAMDGGDL